MTITYEKLDDRHFVVMHDGVPYCVHVHDGPVKVHRRGLP